MLAQAILSYVSVACVVELSVRPVNFSSVNSINLFFKALVSDGQVTLSISRSLIGVQADILYYAKPCTLRELLPTVA